MLNLEKEYRAYRPLVLKMYRTFAIKSIELDDFEQEARIILWRTLKNYNEKLQWTKGTCFKANLKRWLISYYRKQYAKKRTNKNGEPVECITQEYCDTLSYITSKHPEDDFIQKMGFKKFFINFTTKHLSKMEQAAFLQWVSGEKNSYTFKSEEQKKRAILRAKRRFKNFYKEKYEDSSENWWNI